MLLALMVPAAASAQDAGAQSNGPQSNGPQSNGAQIDEIQSNQIQNSGNGAAQAAADEGAPRSANRFVVGVLVDARVVRVDADERFHRLIKLENREGRELIVDLGASPPPEAIGLREGDLVVALGKSARINGHPVLYALYVAPLTELAPIRRNDGRANVDASR